MCVGPTLSGSKRKDPRRRRQPPRPTRSLKRSLPGTLTREDPVVGQLRQQLATAEVELAGLREQFTDRHSQVLAARAKIEEVKARLRRLVSQSLVSKTLTLNPLHQDLASQVIRLEVDRQ